jgi:hypothetical protein
MDVNKPGTLPAFFERKALNRSGFLVKNIAFWQI